MSVPTARELNLHDSLDERAAVERFLGKTASEAVRLFADDGAAAAVEDLRWMGPRAFVYYLPAALAFLESEVALADDRDVVAGLPVTLRFRLRHHPAEIAGAWSTIERICDHVLAHGERLCPEPEARADAVAAYRELRDQVAGLRAAPAAGRPDDGEEPMGPR